MDGNQKLLSGTWGPRGRQDRHCNTKALSPDKPAHCKALPSKCQQARLQQMGHSLLLGRSSAVFRLRFLSRPPSSPSFFIFLYDVFAQPSPPSPYSCHLAWESGTLSVLASNAVHKETLGMQPISLLALPCRTQKRKIDDVRSYTEHATK